MLKLHHAESAKLFVAPAGPQHSAVVKSEDCHLKCVMNKISWGAGIALICHIKK
jgi:hypothetical protein